MATQTQEQARPEKDTWNLAELYASDEAWQEAAARFLARLPELAVHRGMLGKAPASLLAALTLIAELQREFLSLHSYAHMKSDLNTREAGALARAQEADLAGTRFDAASSFVAPEILALPDGTVARFLAAEPALAIHAHQLDNILRRRPHTLSSAEEKLLADAGAMAISPENVYGVLVNADLPWPELVLAGGAKVRLDPSSYVRYRASGIREERREVFRTFFGAWESYSRTFGVTLDAEVKKNIFFARSRRYGSALEGSLDRNAVPVAVYDAMVASANEGLPSLHRYLRLRARMLGVGDLAYHDIYAPLVPSTVREYSPEAAKEMVLGALAPLGPAYLEVLRAGFGNRWIDIWPSTGKRSGAYSNGAVYGTHPFILMNWNGNFDSVTTLAHECGHAMHSHLANQAQPFPTADYSIFVAEVASTFNEALLYRHATERANEDDEKLFLLSSWLDGMRGTFFRQAMFAEFEKAIYEVAQGGASLTGERLGGIYLDLLRKYYGAQQGVCAVDDRYRVEWAYIPHFYMNFYVFQYATGFAASTFLARRALSGEAGAVEGYLDFLRAGGSGYPFDLLVKAGVDLSRPDPYRATVAEMNRVMDEIDAILARRPGR